MILGNRFIMMVKAAIVKTMTNGNVEYKVLNDMDSDMKWLKWSIVFLFAAVLCPFFLKSLGIDAVGIVSGIFAVFGIGIFVCLAVRGHSLGNAEAKLVINSIIDVANRDAEKLKQKVLKVKFYSDTLDSYGTIDEEYVLALLKNKTVLKYPIKQLNRKDERYNHKLIVNKCEICENERQKEQILRKSLIMELVNSALFISFVIWGVIALILGFGVGILYMFFEYVKNVEDMKLPIAVLIGLLAFLPLNEMVDKKLPHNRICDGIRFVLKIPFFILSLTKFAMPSLTIMIVLALMFSYSFLPVYAVVTIIESTGYNITMEGKLFIFLTIPLIIATHCSGYIRGFILRKTPFSGNDHHYYLFMRELVRFVYTKENLNFIIYASYFLFLFISSFKSFQSGASLLSKDLDMIVAKSFLVFIACTNMVDRKKTSNLEGRALLTLLIKMITVHDDEEWRMKRRTHQLKD